MALHAADRKLPADPARVKEEFPFLFFCTAHAVFTAVLPTNLLGMYLS